jgi:hypothetical protein
MAPSTTWPNSTNVNTARAVEKTRLTILGRTEHRAGSTDGGPKSTAACAAPDAGDLTLEALLAARAAEHHCELAIEELGNELTRAALVTVAHPLDDW